MPETRLERAIFLLGLFATVVLAFVITRSWHHTTAAPAPTGTTTGQTRTAPKTPSTAASANGAAEATTATSTETVDLALTASRPTWTEVRAGSATGTVLYTGTLASGTTKSFRDKAIWVRFGVASNVDAHLNGQTLRLPAGTYDAVFDTGGYHHVS